MFKANTVMIMHHKFCLVDTRHETSQELLHREKMKLKQEATRSQQQKKGIPEKPKRKTVQLPPQGVCITGSCNWTMQGFAGNWENIIVTSNQTIISGFQREFERIWSDFIASNKKAEASKIRGK